MFYNFDYHEKRGGVTVACFEGLAHIERCTTDPDEWRIAGITLIGFDDKGHNEAVTLDANDDLYKRIALSLYAHKSQEISDAWDAHRREQKAEAA